MKMANKVSRRQILGLGAATIAGGVALWDKQAFAKNHGGSEEYQPAKGEDYKTSGRPYWEKSYSGGPIDVKSLPPVLPGKGYKPVVVPDGGALPFKVVDGVKVFHLIAEEVDHAFDSGLRARCWGYNGRVNSTVIEAVEGERVRIYVTNRLPVATSVHWHGVYLPNGMDGVGGLTQPHIKPGETAKYEWTLRQHGTFMFHSHHDEMTQMGMGLIGNFVVHPRNPTPDYRVDRDFSLMISEWVIEAGTARPNTVKDSGFNVLTFNGKAFPSTSPLVCKTGDRVRLRLDTVPCTFMVIISALRQRMAKTFPFQRSGQKRRFWLPSDKRVRLNLSPTLRATGLSIAT
jgi:manganese oxidase